MVPFRGFKSHILNPNFFLKLFGHHRDIPAKSRDIPSKKLDFPGFEGHIELFGPTPSHGTPPPHQKRSGPKSWVWVPFSCLNFETHPFDVPLVRSGRGYVDVLGQNGPKWSKRPFWSNDLILNWILAFAKPKWTKMAQNGPFWPREDLRSILVHQGSPTVYSGHS